MRDVTRRYLVTAYAPYMSGKQLADRLPTGPVGFGVCGGRRKMWEREYSSLAEALRMYSQTSYPEGWVLTWKEIPDGTA